MSRFVRSSFTGLRSLLVFTLLATCAQVARASDWPRFRGPSQTGVAAPGSAADWPADPALEVVWKTALGPGYSSLAITDGSIYTGWGEGESDWLGAFDAATGEVKWKLSLGDLYAGHDGSHSGPIATPVVAEIGGKSVVFAVGGHGRLVAATAAGEQVWSRELSEMGKAPFYGFSASPVVFHGDEAGVLVTEVASGEGPTVVGFDPLTGEVLWQLGDDEVHYQSPVVVTLGGQEQVVASGIKTLYGIEPITGSILWSHEYGGEPRAMGPASNVPLHLGGDLLLVKPDASTNIALAVSPAKSGDEGDDWLIESRWTNDDLSRSYAPALQVNGHIFGYKRGFLVAVAGDSGETVWRSRPPGDGFLAAADSYLVVVTKKGSLHLAAASADGWNELASLDLFDHPERDNAVWSDPAIADGAIYARSMSGLARVAVRAATSAEARTQTADAGRGHELPAGGFADFVKSVESADDKSAAVDAFVAARSDTGGFPVIDGNHAIFVFRTDEGSAGIEGDMLGQRTQGQMRQVHGTDLYYFVNHLPSDAWVSYRFVPGLGESVVDPRNDRQVQVMGFQGPEDYSYLTMPDWRSADYMAGEPAPAGRIVHHDVPLPPAEDGEAEDSESEDAETEDAEPNITSRGIDVYLPEGFDAESSETYPVVFVPGADTARVPLALDRALTHYLGHSLPSAVVVLVGPHDPRPGIDLFGNQGAAIDSFLEQVVPFVLKTYPVAAEGPNHSYVGFTMAATQTLGLGLDPRSRAGRLSLIQPFFLDSQRQGLVAAASAKTEHRPHLYFESSPLSLRAEHEGWNAAHQAEKLAETLEGQGYEVALGTSNLPFVVEALRPRVGDALAFALTGTAEVPSED